MPSVFTEIVTAPVGAASAGSNVAWTAGSGDGASVGSTVADGRDDWLYSVRHMRRWPARSRESLRAERDELAERGAWGRATLIGNGLKGRPPRNHSEGRLLVHGTPLGALSQALQKARRDVETQAASLLRLRAPVEEADGP